MGEQEREGHAVSFRTWASIKELRSSDEVWIHCSWMPCLWWAALWGKNVHWVPECSYDPIRRAYHGWKKTLVGPIERFCLRRAKSIVATCEAEKGWIQSYLGKHCPPVEVTDIKRFFDLSRVERVERREGCPLHLLYLGRRHPLKGLECLETAVRQIQESTCSTCSTRLNKNGYPCEFFGSDTSGEKTFEEFYTDTDIKDETTFINLGAVKNSKKRPVEEVEAIFANLRAVFRKPGAEKADVIEVLKEYLPNFQHIEKGKSLDSRM